jgi:hypothetical protein
MFTSIIEEIDKEINKNPENKINMLCKFIFDEKCFLKFNSIFSDIELYYPKYNIILDYQFLGNDIYVHLNLILKEEEIKKNNKALLDKLKKIMEIIHNGNNS